MDAVHKSHVYADRMSSRPRTWGDDGIDKKSRLRTIEEMYTKN